MSRVDQHVIIIRVCVQGGCVLIGDLSVFGVVEQVYHKLFKQ